MRIAFLPDDYLPDSTRVHAKMFNELAVEFQRCGHKAVVITPGTPTQKDRLVIDEVNGVEVWRFRSGTLRGVGMVKRAINESLLSYNAWRAIRHKVKDEPFDMCVNWSPTIFFGPLVRKLKSYSECRTYLILRDIFPQWAIDEGLIKEGSIVAKYFRFFERLNYRAVDRIGLQSEANVTYFQSLHPDFNNLEVLHNWSDLQVHATPRSLIDIREKIDAKDKVLFFYGGNIGHAQDMANLLRLVRGMKDEPKAHFLFVGQGDEYTLVQEKQQEWKLDNMTLLPSVDQETYKDILTQVDVGVFSLAKSHKAHNFPGKLLGYKANSLPILGSLNLGNDLADYINDMGAGFAYINGQDAELLDAAKRLTNNSPQREQIGKQARNVLEQHFSVESAVQNILELSR